MILFISAGHFNMTSIKGFSLVEILAVIAIVTVLAAVGIDRYVGYVETSRSQLLQTVSADLEKQINREVSFLGKGLKSGLTSIDTGEALTDGSTCDDFVRALQKKYEHFRNPFDGSPLITLWPGWRTMQKRGKLRITCYKVLHGMSVSGSYCPLKHAAIRIDTYKVDCGASCHSPHCQIPNKNCSGTDARSLFTDMETNELFGDTWPKTAQGRVDYPGAVADCGVGWKQETIPQKEADY